MEILLNCVWLVLGLSLISAWSAHAWRTRTCEPEKLLPSRRLQFTALLMLVILLFPVISVTDDIAMCTAPRDAERALRLHDPFDGSQPTPGPSAVHHGVDGCCRRHAAQRTKSPSRRGSQCWRSNWRERGCRSTRAHRLWRSSRERSAAHAPSRRPRPHFDITTSLIREHVAAAMVVL